MHNEPSCGNLSRDIQNYIDKGLYPWHMPGHKRQLWPVANLPYGHDLTEVTGTDDLHRPEGIIKSAQERASQLFGSDGSYFLVGGSTVGNLSAISALAPAESEIIAAGNSHKSVFNAIMLRGYTVHWIWPKLHSRFGIFSSISPSDLKGLLKKYPKSKAVIITSPSYEGIISDIKNLAEICHRHNIPLMVDEAHGSHLGLGDDYWPSSAIMQGADIAVQSLHKTLPSLTQTAILHRRGKLITDYQIRRWLDVYETSSPSYLLMESIDGCIDYLQKHKEEAFRQLRNSLTLFRGNMKELHNLELFSADDSEIYDYDPSKLLIRNLRGSGQELSNIMRDKYGLETEYSLGSNVLLISTIADDEKAFEELYSYLRSIDALLDGPKLHTKRLSEDDGDMTAFQAVEAFSSREESLSEPSPLTDSLRQFPMTIGKALEAASEIVSIRDALGRISGEYVYAYPPGIPFIIPGERINSSRLDILENSPDRDKFIYSSETDHERLDMGTDNSYDKKDCGCDHSIRVVNIESEDMI
ncbi:aminotransferase class I/II-fold pyridoxal phosphate-dependent enzyme [Butyrivibrio sp. MC2013]|uniref:aminotransferase class I/II-fold pyridoxal phosphate-dependent enzyme n=1 Tax=Butyrivibrio sp. MC2013 TaxID=1280686 RepID=UPI000479C4A1|nr:aminotransferase class I/II-fold pyridoxal phosphate-dependent enzyme [Butyrivibrio sp. MC2013]